MTRTGLVMAAAIAAGCGGSPAASDGADAGPGRDAGGSARDAGDAAIVPDASPDASPDARPDASPDAGPPVTLVDPDPTGSDATRFGGGAEDPAGPFFTALGSNGRSCGTCHDRTAGWSVTTTALQARFDATAGADPIFRPIDGATSPSADVSTLAARQAAYEPLLTKGLIRIEEAIPAGAEFTLMAVDDPNSAAGYTLGATRMSLFRRILPATNLRFIASIMWDGREASLTSQATDATTGHGQATSAVPAQMSAIVAFEDGQATAQTFDTTAGDLGSDGATGGVAALAAQPFHVGINDSLGRDPQGGAFDPNVFTQFAAWATLTGSDPATQRQLSIARGEALFNAKKFRIAGVPGFPDEATATGTCTSCHDTPGTGAHSVDEMMSLQLDSASRRSDRLTDLPLYTLVRTSDGSTIQTTDPGRAIVTGKWADIGEVKVGSLRDLAARAPYFHNGFSPDLADVVSFYNDKFSIGLSSQDMADMVAFLEAL